MFRNRNGKIMEILFRRKGFTSSTLLCYPLALRKLKFLKDKGFTLRFVKASLMLRENVIENIKSGK